jgi:hypothetical protein
MVKKFLDKLFKKTPPPPPAKPAPVVPIPPKSVSSWVVDEEGNIRAEGVFHDYVPRYRAKVVPVRYVKVPSLFSAIWIEKEGSWFYLYDGGKVFNQHLLSFLAKEKTKRKYPRLFTAPETT